MAKARINSDEVTLKLMEEVNKRKKDIAKSENAAFITNCSFSYTEGRQNDNISLHVEVNIKNLVCIAAFLQEKEAAYLKTADYLGIEDIPPFTWQGYKVSEWVEDIKSKISKVQINLKKKKLEQLESRLNAIVTPELRAQMELEAIANELK